MGSVGRDYVCPICGRKGNGGYACDWIGYPTCNTCNDQEGGIFDGSTAAAMRRRQLQALCGHGQSTLKTLLAFTALSRRISRYLTPSRDYDDECRDLST